MDSRSPACTRKISHKFKEVKAIWVTFIRCWQILFSGIVWLILDRLKIFPVGASIQNLEIMKDNQSDPLHKRY